MSGVVYFDTSVIASCYFADARTSRALEVRTRFSPPLVLTELHRVEVTAALMAKVFRGETSAHTVETALANLEFDMREGVWRRPGYELTEVFESAESLSRQWGATLGTRSLDTLHVAAAIVLVARHFVTGDQRQAELARAAGLQVTLI